MRAKIDLSVSCLIDADIVRRINTGSRPSIRANYNLSVVRALRRLYRRVGLVGAVDVGLSSMEELVRLRPDVIFNLACSGHPAEAAIVGCLDLIATPYTGSGPGAIALANDKIRSRHLLRSAGIRVPRFAELSPELPAEIDLTPPLIVKPVSLGGCVGIHADSVVTTRQGVLRLARRIWRRLGTPAVCDEFVVGREFRIGLIESVAGWKVAGITEWHFGSAAPGWGFKTETIVKNRRYRRSRGVYRRLARLSRQTSGRLVAIVQEAVQILGVRGYATADVRMDDLERVTLLEVNANPGLWSGSSIWSNPDFDTNIERIVDSAAVVHLTKNLSWPCE